MVRDRTRDLENAPQQERRRPADAWSRRRSLAKNRELLIGLTIFVAVVVLVAILPVFWSADPLEQALTQRLRPPFWQAGGALGNPLGTDGFGRDLLSRLLYGGRYSIAISSIAVAVAGIVGVTLGASAGYFRGRPESVIMRVVDAQQALPAVLLALLMVVIFGSTLVNVVLVLAITGWATYARVVFGVVRSIREREFIVAAVAQGAQARRIIWTHVLPNAMTPIIVTSTLQVARTMLLESGLSYLGLGVPDPLPAWGLMLADGQRNIFSAWWLATLPGLAITVTVFSLNLIGGGLRRALDPHSRGS